MALSRKAVILILALAITRLSATDEATLKLRVQARSQAVVDLLVAGAVFEGGDGLLNASGSLDPRRNQLVQEENQDRGEIYGLVAAKTKLSVDEVKQMYAKRARARWPPQSSSSGLGPCKIVPTKNADVLRLLEYMKQGINYASQKKFDSALAEFQGALLIDKNFLGLQLNVGSAQMALKKYSEAEASFKGELKLDGCLGSLSVDQLSQFGYFMEVGENDPAMRKKAQAEKLKAELPRIQASAQYNLACIYSSQKQKDQALEAVRAAVNAGFSDKKALASDPDLGFIRQTPEFREITARVH